MAFFEISPDQLSSLIKYVNEGNRDGLTDDAVSQFINLNAALTKRLSSDAASYARKSMRLEKKVESYKEDEKKRLHKGQVVETGFDSVEIIRALLFQMNTRKSYGMTKQKLQTMAFRMYASWLADKNERIFDERPVAGKFGPVFWKIASKTDPKMTVTKEDFEFIMSRNPGLACYISNVAAAYYDKTERQICGDLTKIQAYKDALPENNDGKWNKILDDAQIVDWINDLHRREKARREIHEKENG